MQSWLIASVVALSATYCAVLALYEVRETTPSGSTEVLWSFVFAILVTWWAKVDTKGRASPVQREIPSFLMFILWPIILPYHLVKSRGSEGVVLFFGFLTLYLAPYMAVVIVATIRD